MKEIEQSNEIRICISPFPPQDTFEPKNCRENCKFGGYAYDLSMAFVGTLKKGITAKFMRVEWDEQFFNKDGKVVREDAYTPELLATGKCDLFAPLTKIDWRLSKFDFVTQNLNRMVVVVNKKKRTQFNGAADLAGKLAATMKESSWQTWMEEQNRTTYSANPIQINFVPSRDVLKAVDNEVADFAISDMDLAMWFTKHELKNSVIAFAVGQKTELAWAFRRGDTDLKAALEKFVETQRNRKTSALNKVWLNNYGITLPEFIDMINQTK